MKMNRITTALLIGAITVTSVIAPVSPFSFLTQTVYAATSNALGQDVNIFYNGKTVKFGAYNIGGYNYFRIADVGSLLNFATTQEQVYLGTEYYIKMISNKVYGPAIAPVSTQGKNADVTLSTMKLQFDDYTGAIQRFNLNDRNYFKLGDIVAISQENYNRAISSVVNQAKQGIGTKVNVGMITTKLDTAYDGNTKTITITKTTTDLQKVYEGEYYKIFGADKFKQTFGKDYTATGDNKETPSPTPTPAPTPTPVTTPPEVGSYPAKILKDPSKGAYLSNGNVNWDNFESAYRGGSAGQCTWYAEGRFAEIFNYSIAVNPYDFTDVAKDSNLKVITDPKAIASQSIAVFGNQHVTFVEFVERDANGNPTYIYYTEANGDSNDKYDINKGDGAVFKQTYSDFLKSVGSKAPYKGCITKN